MLPQLGGQRRILNVGGWEDSDREGGKYRDYFADPATYHISNLHQDNERGRAANTDLDLDITQPLRSDLHGAYEIVFSHTVLEHVAKPWTAFENLASLSTDLVITVVPWKQKLHLSPGNYQDYYRFSPLALRHLAEESGLRVVYDSYTPLPALDVYILSVASFTPEKYEKFFPPLSSAEELNNEVGSFNAKALLQNIGMRLLKKFTVSL